ncbi:MAG: hypothetical protein ACR2GL_00210 [Thermoleophilaceae bacterium]
MEARHSTPTDGSRPDPFGSGSGEAEDDLYAGTDGATSTPHDWSAHYGGAPPPPPPSGPDLSALLILLDGLRRAAPDELQGRLTSLTREALLTLRSLIDWYLERLESDESGPEVEHIPVE